MFVFKNLLQIICARTEIGMSRRNTKLNLSSLCQRTVADAKARSAYRYVTAFSLRLSRIRASAERMVQHKVQYPSIRVTGLRY